MSLSSVTAEQSRVRVSVHTCVIGVSLQTASCNHISRPEHFQHLVFASESQAIFVGDGEETGALLRKIRRRLEHTDLLHLTELKVLRSTEVHIFMSVPITSVQ